MTSSDFIPLESLQTAVLFLVFNRPDTTAQVFDAIRKAQPPRLYVAADGPRADRACEAEKVDKVREIATAVDWPCEVRTLFRDDNLGCKYAVSDAITWFFDHEEQGIILEDDCLPHPDFFTFCDVLLERYADDERVSFISGDNFQRGLKRGDASYYFSHLPHLWGWATWRRVWQFYDVNMSYWPEWKISDSWRRKHYDKVERKYWEKIFDITYAQGIDTYDYQIIATAWRYGGLTATPNKNLVSNIGFGPDATHTFNKSSRSSNNKTSAIGIIDHPREIKRDVDADRSDFDWQFGGKTMRFPYSIARFIKGFLKYSLRFFINLTREIKK